MADWSEYTMTTRQFIANTIGIPSYKNRSCSSVFTDNNGTVFSYGYHYPLATIINGKGYINNRGYSMSTAKHIGWAWSALYDRLGNANVYSIPLTNGDSLNPRGIKSSAEREIERLKQLIATKKRKDTWIYQDLQNQLAKAEEVLASI